MRSLVTVHLLLDFAPSPDCHIVGVAGRVTAPSRYPSLLMNGDFESDFSEFSSHRSNLFLDFVALFYKM